MLRTRLTTHGRRSLIYFTSSQNPSQTSISLRIERGRAQRLDVTETALTLWCFRLIPTTGRWGIPSCAIAGILSGFSQLQTSIGHTIQWHIIP